MRRALVALFVVGLLSGPFVSVSSANPTFCKLAEKLGVVWVRECE
jgi:hypothetical protein